MKPVQLLLFTLLLTFLFHSCHDRPYPATLLKAEVLVNSRPDSALDLLQHFKDSIALEPSATQMYYRLLLIKAKDKMRIVHTSDSAILEVVRYFEQQHHSAHLPEAYYYAGRVYSDLQDAPQALDYFNEAADLLEKQPNNELGIRLYSQIGTLLLYQSVYDKALPVFEKAYQCSVESNDSSSMVYNFRDMGRTYSTLNQQDSAIHYYKKAEKLAEKIKDDRLRRVVNGELAGYYTELEKYEEAYRCLQIRSRKLTPANMTPYYATAAQYYFYTQQLDSASYYYSRLIESEMHSSKSLGYKGLGNIAYLKGDYKDAIQKMYKHQAYRDSTLMIEQTEAVRRVNALYDYQFREDENHLLKAQTKQQKDYIIIAAISILLLITMFIIYRQRQKRKEEHRLLQLNKLKAIEEEKYKQSQAYIIENKERIEQLEVELKKAEESQDQLKQGLYRAQKSSLEKLNEQIETHKSRTEKATQVLKASAIYKRFDAASEKLPIEDWEALTQAIDETYQQFTQRLAELHPMKDVEMQICLLLKAEFSLGQIAQIVVRSKQAVTSIRKRLYSKVFNKEGSPDEWDKFIRNF